MLVRGAERPTLVRRRSGRTVGVRRPGSGGAPLAVRCALGANEARRVVALRAPHLLGGASGAALWVPPAGRVPPARWVPPVPLSSLPEALLARFSYALGPVGWLCARFAYGLTLSTAQGRRLSTRIAPLARSARHTERPMLIRRSVPRWSGGGSGCTVGVSRPGFGGARLAVRCALGANEARGVVALRAPHLLGGASGAARWVPPAPLSSLARGAACAILVRVGSRRGALCAIPVRFDAQQRARTSPCRADRATCPLAPGARHAGTRHADCPERRSPGTPAPVTPRDPERRGTRNAEGPGTPRDPERRRPAPGTPSARHPAHRAPGTRRTATDVQLILGPVKMAGPRGAALLDSPSLKTNEKV